MKTKQDAREALSLYSELAAADTALASLAAAKLTDTLNISLGNGQYVLNDAPMGLVACTAIGKELVEYWTKCRSRVLDELRQRGFE